MSTLATSFFTVAIAAGCLRSSTIERLPALSWPNIVEAPSRNTGRERIRSPSGDSTLITSAPMSASRREQWGPAMVVEKSRTLRPVSGRGRSVMRSPFNEDEDDTAHDEKAAQPLAGGGAFLQDDMRRDESKDQLDLADGAHEGRVLESHGECPAGRAQHAEDADPDRGAPVDADLAELRAVAVGEIAEHQHDLDRVHGSQRRDPADQEVSAREILGRLADRASGDGEEDAREDTEQRTLVREVGKYATDIRERPAYAQDGDATQAHDDAEP